jgi:hypothetical protein
MGALMKSHSWTWKASFGATRILAVYLVVHALILAGNSASLLVIDRGASRWAAVIAILVLAAAGIELWLVADGFANRIAGAADELDLPQEDEEETGGPPAARSGIDATSALSIGLTLLGIVILVDGLAALILAIGQLIQIESTRVGVLRISRPPLTLYVISLGTSALRIVAGAWLTFGSQDIAGFLQKLRTRTSEPTTPNP